MKKVVSKVLSLVDTAVAGLAVVKIKNPAQFTGAAELLSQLNTKLDQVVAEKEKVTKPLNEALRAERERFKPYEKKLENAIEILRGEMLAYQQRMLAVQRSVAEKVAKEVASGKMDMGVGVKKLAVVNQTVVESVSTASGAVKFRTDKVVRIVDVSLVPRAFMVVDLKAIREALIGGKAVSGAVLEEVQTVVNRR